MRVDHQPSGLPLDAARLTSHRTIQILAAKLALARQSAGSRRTLFVSPGSAAGTTTLAACTALVLAREFHKDVVLVEANLSAPAAASYLGLSTSPGIQDVLKHRVDASDAVRNSIVPGLHILAAGDPEDGTPIGVASPEVIALIEDTASKHDFMILDGPPLVEQPVGQVHLKCVDQVVLVLRAGDTSKDQAQEATLMIRSAGVALLGVVLNRFRPQSPLGLADRRWR